MLGPCASLRGNSAKHLAAQRERSFATLRMTSDSLSMTSDSLRMTSDPLSIIGPDGWRDEFVKVHLGGRVRGIFRRCSCRLYFSGVYAAVLGGKHCGDRAHDLVGRLVNILTRDLLARGFEDHGFPVADGYARTKLFEYFFAAPNGDRHHGNAGAQRDHAHTGMGFCHGAGSAAGPFGEHDQDIAFL